MNPDVLRFGHSPDPDDAFMFYGFERGAVQVEVGDRRWRVEHLLEDIQSLNERAMAAELEITAISAHAYPFVAEHYWVMRTGVSMGDGYGPLVVSGEERSLESLRGSRIGVPGMLTTGLLVLKLLLEDFRPVVLPFDGILEEVAKGTVDAGIIIHEGQLTWAEAGVKKVADLGALWKERTGQPLPLGLDVVRKDLGSDVARAASSALRRSIEFARAHNDEAVRYALRYGRGLDVGKGETFIGMYVNDWTLDMGDAGRRALVTLLDAAAGAGLVPETRELMLV